MPWYTMFVDQLVVRTSRMSVESDNIKEARHDIQEGMYDDFVCMDEDNVIYPADGEDLVVTIVVRNKKGVVLDKQYRLCSYEKLHKCKQGEWDNE